MKDDYLREKLIEAISGIEDCPSNRPCLGCEYSIRRIKDGRVSCYDLKIIDALLNANIVTDVDVPALIEGKAGIAVQGKGFMVLYNEAEIEQLKYQVKKLGKALKFLSHKIALEDASTPIVVAMEREEQAALQKAEQEIQEEENGNND